MGYLLAAFPSSHQHRPFAPPAWRGTRATKIKDTIKTDGPGKCKHVLRGSNSGGTATPVAMTVYTRRGPAASESGPKKKYMDLVCRSLRALAVAVGKIKLYLDQRVFRSHPRCCTTTGCVVTSTVQDTMKTGTDGARRSRWDTREHVLFGVIHVARWQTSSPAAKPARVSGC